MPETPDKTQSEGAIRPMNNAYAFVFLLVAAGAFTPISVSGSQTDSKTIAENLEKQFGELDYGSKIDKITEALLGTPYRRDPLGEGDPLPSLDPDPIFDLSQFDCTTFVESATALALAKDANDFVEILQRIRYRDGAIEYSSRNHFTSQDWIPNNIAAGYFSEFLDEFDRKGLVQESKTAIDKKNWFLKKAETEKNTFKAGLLDKAADAAGSPNTFSLKYVSRKLLLKDSEQMDFLLRQIPTGSVISFVAKPDPRDLAEFGTYFDVVHQAILIQKPDGPVLRHARINKKKVVEGSFAAYLKSRAQLLGFHALEPNLTAR